MAFWNSWFSGWIKRDAQSVRANNGIIWNMEDRDVNTVLGYSGDGTGYRKFDLYGVPAFNRAVTFVSTKVGCCKAGVFEYQDDGSSVLDTANPAYTLVARQVNPYLSPADLITRLTADALVEGDGYAAKFANQLWIQEPHTVTPIIITDIQNKLTQSLSYLVMNDRGSTVLDASEMIHIRSPIRGRNGLRGLRLLDYARLYLGMTINEHRYANAFYVNAGLADADVEIYENSSIDPETAAQIKSALMRRSGGVDKMREPVVVQGRINRPNRSLADGQLIESRTLDLIMYGLMLGVPPHKLGANVASAYGSLLAENEAMLADCFMPWLNQWNFELSRKLLNTSEYATHYIELDKAGITAGDDQSEATIRALKLSSGQISWQESRRQQKLSTIINEDDLWDQAATFGPLVKPEPVIPALPQTPPETPQGEAAQPEDQPTDPVSRGRETLKATIDRLVKRVSKDVIRRGQTSLVNRHEAVFREALPEHSVWASSFLQNLEDELGNVLPEQREGIIKAINTDELVEEIWN